MKKNRIRLSQCMIVKDEEKNIEQALSWGKDIMWEQIVVDTGSSDRTVELAEALGARVYHFPWIDDFAAAKNFALEQAEGDWIAFLDADEYIPQDMVKKIPALLRELHESTYLTLICDLMNQGENGKIFSGSSQMRLFRNKPEIRYVGRIHEELKPGNRFFGIDDVLDVSEDFSIIHTGYSSSIVGEKEKGKRNRILLLKELEEHPDNTNLMGYIGDTYFADGEFDEAIVWFEKAIDKIPETPVSFHDKDSQIFSSLMTLLSMNKEEERLMEVYEKGIKHLPEDAEMDYIVGSYFARSGVYEKGIYHLEKALHLLEEYGSRFRAARMSGNVGGAWELLALCYYGTERLEQCVSCCTNLLKIQPYIIKTLMILLLAFAADAKRAANRLSTRPAASAVQVLTFLGGIYDLQSGKDRLFILKAAMEAGYVDMIREVRATFSEAEMEALDRAMEQKHEEKDV